MGCFCSKHDTRSEEPINEPRPQLTEPRYDNSGQTGAGNHSPPTAAPNEPAPHEIGVAVTTPENTATQQQQQQPYELYNPQGTTSTPQAPAVLPESAADGDNKQDNVRARSGSSSSSSSSTSSVSNRNRERTEEGNRG